MLQANLLVLDFSPNNGLGSQVVDVLASCRKPGLQTRYESVSQDVRFIAVTNAQTDMLSLQRIADHEGKV